MHLVIGFGLFDYCFCLWQRYSPETDYDVEVRRWELTQGLEWFNPDTPNHEGLTMLECATEFGDTVCLEVLREYYAARAIKARRYA